MTDCGTPGISTAVIVLAALLAAILLSNAICCFMFKRRKKSPTQAPPVQARDPSVDAEMGSLK